MKVKLILVCVLSFVFLASCDKAQSTSTNEKSLTAEQKSFVWHKTREKRFSVRDYPSIDETEARKVIQENFQLEIPAFLENGQKVLNENLGMENLVSSEKYQIYSTETEVTFAYVLDFKNPEGVYVSYGEIILKYQYIESLKTVKLYSQNLSIYNDTTTGKYNGKEFNQTITDLGQLLKLADVDQLLQDFTKKVSEQENIANQGLAIYTTFAKAAKEETFGENFGVIYGDNNVPKKIYAVTIDYTY